MGHRSMVLAAAWLVACQPGQPRPRVDAEQSALPVFRHCAERSAPPEPARKFRHRRSAVLAAAWEPRHHAQDVLARPEDADTLAVKFSYAKWGKDLEDEDVALLLDDCRDWVALVRQTTDDDGRIAAAFSAPDAPGEYGFVARVAGDRSEARGRITVLPERTEIVVFDIDGTLTVDDMEVTIDATDEFVDVAPGDYDAVAVEHGPELTRLWYDKQYVLVYLTGRPYWLLDHTRQWLDRHGFAPGVVHTTDRHRDVVPNGEGVGEFKRRYLEDLLRRNYTIVAAYGNATTDITAYREVEIDPTRTFIIGPHGGEQGTRAIVGDYRSHLAWAAEQRPAIQPFVREW